MTGETSTYLINQKIFSQTADTPDGDVTGYIVIPFSSPCYSYCDDFPDPGRWKYNTLNWDLFQRVLFVEILLCHICHIKSVIALC